MTIIIMSFFPHNVSLSRAYTPKSGGGGFISFRLIKSRKNNRSIFLIHLRVEHKPRDCEIYFSSRLFWIKRPFPIVLFIYSIRFQFLKLRTGVASQPHDFERDLLQLSASSGFRDFFYPPVLPLFRVSVCLYEVITSADLNLPV